MNRIIPALLLICFSSAVYSTPGKHTDPHYNDAGFFDIHVCNWPDRPLFFMLLFSTYEFKQIKSINIFTPDKKQISTLDLSKFRLVQRKDKPEKRVFIHQEPVQPDWPDGWYTAEIHFKNGKTYRAEDFVVVTKLPIASRTIPAHNAENVKVPEKLAWEAVPGAKHYQVFLRDSWNDDKLIFQSKLLNTNEVALPEGLLEEDGMYSWKIHARDTNEHELLGDFNHGSLSQYYKFSTGAN